jgi:hypothetical protein
MPLTSPLYSRSEIETIAARNQAARHIIAGFAAQMPALAGIWQQLDTALVGSQALCAEVARLSTDLAAARLDRANLLAAMRAAIAAHADREPDPLYYIRDELNARQKPPQRHGRPS